MAWGLVGAAVAVAEVADTRLGLKHEGVLEEGNHHQVQQLMQLVASHVVLLLLLVIG